MNLRLCALAFLGLSAAGLLRAETFREPFNEVRPLRPGGRVVIDNTNGAISVRTWDRNEVGIGGEKQAGDRGDLPDLRVEIDATGDSVVIRGRQADHGWLNFMHWGRSESIRFVVTIPANARLERAHTVNGAIDLDGVAGPVRASVVNGSVRGSGLTGPADFSTVNGSVEAEFAAVAGGDRLSFNTVNGSIQVTLPRTATVEARTSTVNGRVTSDLPAAAGRSGGRPVALDARTVNGGISLKAVPDRT